MARKTSPVEKVISAFGGVAAFAEKLGVSATTVQAWKRRGAIPPSRHDDIIGLAGREGMEFDAAILSGEGKRIPPRIGETGDVETGAAIAVSRAPEKVPEEAAGEAVHHPVSHAFQAVGKTAAEKRAHWQHLAMWGLAGLVFLIAVITAASRMASMGVGRRDGMVSVLETRIAGLQQQADAATRASTDANREIQRLLERLSALEKAGPRASEGFFNTVNSLQGTVSSVREEMAQLGETVAQVQKERQTAEAAALALGQLRVAVDASAPFREDLDAAVALVSQLGDDVGGARAKILDALHRLDFYADQGVATVAELRDRFDALAGDAVNAARVPLQAGVPGRVLQWLSSFVKIRRVPSEMEGSDAEAMVARAQARLKRGDLATAVSEIRKLDAAAAAVVEPWLALAESRLAVNRAAASLSRKAIQRLAPMPVIESPLPQEVTPLEVSPTPLAVPAEGAAP